MDTIKVQMNVSISSPDWNFQPLQVVEFDTDLANAWVDCGHALTIKGEKVNKVVLDENVQYLGFGQFSVFGQRVLGKAEANAAVKDIPEETKTAYAEKLAQEAAEEAARQAVTVEAGETNVEGSDPANV